MVFMAISVHKPEETVSVRRRQDDLILQVREVEHGRVRHVRPVQQIGALLQGEIQGRNDPGNDIVRSRQVQDRCGRGLRDVNGAGV